VSQNVQAKEMENAANELALRAQLESFAGNNGAARKLCRQATAMKKDSGSELWRCGEALAFAGELPQAEAVARKLDKMSPEDTLQQKVYIPLIHSIVERRRGSPAKAAAMLGPAMKYQATIDLYYQRGLANLAAGLYSDAIADFEELLSHRGWNWWQIYAPLAQLALARAYARQGDLQRSRRAYDNFFMTWKDAELTIPLLRQAKAEHNKLGLKVQ
jgi:eukaryotic-like serine/threonine-protein kinase